MPLKQFATLQRGYDLPHGRRKPGSVPVVTSSGIGDSHSEAKVAGPGVVTGRYGTIGKVFYIKEAFWPLNTTLYVKDFHGNDPLFVANLLRTIDFHSHSGKSGVPGVNRNDLHELIVLRPPLAAQRAIGSAIADVDAILDALDQLIAKKCDITIGATQQLLSGACRLPQFGRGGESFQRSDLGMIPGDWEVARLGDRTLKVGSGLTPTGGSRVYKQHGRPFVRSQNVGWGQLLMDDIAYLDDDTHARFHETEIRDRDVLLNITGASIGRSTVADARITGGNVNQHVCIIRPKVTELDPIYLNQYLISGPGQRQIDSFQAGGNREGLNFGQIKSFRIPLPTLKEQIAIGDVITDMRSEIAALQQRRDKTLLLKQGMLQELLTGRTRLI